MFFINHILIFFTGLIGIKYEQNMDQKYGTKIWNKYTEQKNTNKNIDKIWTDIKYKKIALYEDCCRT